MRHLARSVAACAYGYALPVVVFSLLLTGSPANAHNSADWYYEKWSSATYSGIQMDKHVDWRFVDNVPTSARSRVRDGADDWSSLAASMDFFYPTQQADYSNLDWPNCDPNVNSDTYQKDKIGWSDFGSPGWHTSEALAVTLICDLGTGYLWQFKIAFNADAPWYMGTGNTPSDQDELWGTAAHEFGHATGRTIGGDGQGHFPAGSALCPTPNDPNFATDYHTMCPFIWTGTSVSRSLETHDKDTFKDAY